VLGFGECGKRVDEYTRLRGNFGKAGEWEMWICGDLDMRGSFFEAYWRERRRSCRICSESIFPDPLGVSAKQGL
jgi:hypothetical protein